MIFKAGKYPQGDWPKERVQKMVDAYDSEKNAAAPVVIGHRYWGDSDEYQFAHGWVEGLRMDGAGKVYANIPEFSAEIKKAMAENKLRYISAEIYEPDKADSAQTPYLRAVALLGRDSPAIPSTRLPTLFGFMDSGTITSTDEQEHTVTFTRRVNSKEIQNLSVQETNNHKEDTTVDKIEELQAELTKKEEMLAAFKKENNELKLIGKKAESEAYFEKLRDEGKLPPAIFKQAVDFDVQLDAEAQKEFRAFFEQAKPILDFSGKHIADKKIAQDQGASGFSLTARIRAFQKERNLSSFKDAADILHTENPALFEEEGTP
jgi:hypothetical protein